MQLLASVLPPAEMGTAQFSSAMSLIKNCTVVICNGNVVGMHPTEEEASKQSHEIALEWKRQTDCGAEVPVPKLSVLDFNSWMELQAMLGF